MRKQALFLLLLSTLLSTATFANKVIIKGTIKYASGAIAPGRTVILATYPSSNTTGCQLVDSTATNPNGYFIDSLLCNTDIRKVTVSTRNCNGELLQKTLEVPASGVVTVEFILNCPLVQCRPEFKWERADSTSNVIYFNSKNSYPGILDSIIRRVWTFGDGTANEGNAIEVKKEFKQPGTYLVCLKITTKNGCTNTLCQTILIAPPPVICKANFVWERIPITSISGFGFRFNSGPTSIAPMDSIVKRTWIFGDGDTLRGNEINPVHIYKKPGKYEVCLIIKTKKGCESRDCKLLLTELPNCKPIVKFEFLPKTNDGLPVRFNSMLNNAPNIPGDSIIGRRWTFGDGSTLQENIPNPLHVYKNPGQYNVCLVIKTKSGCYDSSCVIINIPPPPSACQAYFTMEVKPLLVKFNSNPSLITQGDSIVKRTWRFGDGKVLEGNVVDPYHQYEKAGQYEVCLVIVTKKGCESKVCKLVVVPPVTSNVPRCQSMFTIAKRDGNRIVFDSRNAITNIADDSIVSRRWDFGNGRILTGNVIAPVTEYPPFGAKYTVCLTIKTAKGCESKYCMTVEARNSQSPYDSSKVWLVKNYPNPVQKIMYAVIYSPRDNEQVEIAVLDVYGVIKSNIKVIVPKGYSTHNINTSALLPGPYLLRVRSKDGVQSRNFYKVP